MLCDLNLFAFMAFVERDDGATCTIWCLKLEVTVCRYLLITVAVVAMDLKLLLVVRLVVNGGGVCHLVDDCD